MKHIFPLHNFIALSNHYNNDNDDNDDDDDDDNNNNRCAKITFKRGKLISPRNLVIDNNREIQELEQGKTYKYLGTEESEGI